MVGGIVAINARVQRYTRFIQNLRLMTLALSDLNRDMAPHWTQESRDFAGRFTFLLKYYRGVFGNFCTWVQAQNGTCAQSPPTAIWTDYTKALFAFNVALASLPAPWRAVGNIVNDPAAPQIIPAEALLELVVQVFLDVYDRNNATNTPGALNTPDLVQNTLRTQLADGNNFPVGRAGTYADGFSQCIFVTQSTLAAPAARLLVAGSTNQIMSYIGQDAITTAFTTLRATRFTANGRTYGTELKGRFNDNDLPNTSPQGRYLQVRETPEYVPWVRGASGVARLAYYATAVTDTLIHEYTQMIPPRVWHTFNYPNQSARSNFGPIVHIQQLNWFWPVPRCLKCRVIHNYTIVAEDMGETAAPNVSLQCAEDIMYGKLRELGMVA
ncbi:hypothetical protein MMC18_007232 [Xylographa bjoerkii]|nr:hypothetical protein [Xylographa bjoerkii]